ncbi:MAG: hypothetical protein Fur006_56170 [Coleofasciculaceae cyanobacterium]
MTLTALLTLAATLTISDFPLISKPLLSKEGEIKTGWVLAQTPDARKAEANRLLNQGIEQFQTSQIEAALQSFQQALVIYREIKDRQGEARALGSLGATYLSLNDLAHAIKYIEQSLTIAKEINNRQLEETAQKLLSFAQDLQSLNPPRKAEADQLLQQGIQQFNTSQFEAAKQSWQQALIIYREIKDRKGEGNALGNLGVAYDSLGDYAKAIDYHQQSLAILREIKDRKGEGTVLGNLGIAYKSLGEYAKAIEYHQQHLAIAREIKNRLGEGQSLGSLGIAYYHLGEYAKAIDYHQQSLAILRKLKNRKGEGTVLGNLGSAIALAPDSSYKEEIGKVNGLLTAEEILDMKLNAELVVLLVKHCLFFF